MFALILILFFIIDSALSGVMAETLKPEVLSELRQELARMSDEQQRHADFVWVLDCIALVMFMQVGFLLVEAGLVRTKNTVNVALKNYSDFFLAVVCFYLLGFTFMFSSSLGGFIGFDFNYISNVLKSNWDLAYFTYQAMFIGTAATIVSGAIAERMKFSSYCFITVALTLLIYPVFGHWVWGATFVTDNQPWLAALGYMDFAGGTVVHALAGSVSLAAVIIIGPRIGKFTEDGKAVHIPGHSMVLAATGALILYVGWIGFNAGSTRASSPVLAIIILNTVLAGSFGGFSAMIIGRYLQGYNSPETMINGVLSGLVIVTAGCNVLSPNAAAFMGALAGLIYIVSYNIVENTFKLDDAVGAVSVHGVNGLAGTLLIPLFASSDKLATGFWLSQLGVQALGAFICFAWAFGLGYLILKVASLFSDLRVSEEDELKGLNRTEHHATMGNYDIERELLRIASGEADLSTRLNEDTADESAELAKLINPFLERFQELVSSVSDTSNTLSKDLELISSVVHDSAYSLKDNSTEVEESSLAVNNSTLKAAAQAEIVTRDTKKISDTAEEVSANIREIADVIDNLSNSISSIDKSAANADTISQEALSLADNAKRTISNLTNAAEQIDSVVKLIEEVQSKTNLLALNATIESERAGEFGRGFAVVAQEVRTLSQSAAGATDEIRQCLGEIKKTSSGAASILQKVGETVGVINQSVSDIRITANRESKAINDISSGVIGSANEISDVSKNISQLSEQVSNFSSNVQEAAERSKDGMSVVNCLKDEVANSLQTAQMVEMSSDKLTGLADKLQKTSGAK